MSIFGGMKKKKVIAVLDIAGASVGGILIRQGDPIQVISSARKPVNFLLDVDFSASRRCTIDALGKVTKKLLKDFPSGPDAVLCVFSSPWFASQVKIASIRQEKSFEIKKGFFDKLLASEEEKFKEESSLAGALWGNELKFIERENIKMELNGYFIESPTGGKAKSVKAHLYLSLGVKQIMEKAEKEVLKNFGSVPLLFKTLPFVAFVVLNNIIRAEESFLAADIGGEATDIYLIKNNTLSETVSFPRGVNFLVRNTAAKLNTFPGEALSSIKTYLRGRRSPESSVKIDALIKRHKEEWFSFFNEAAAGIAKNTPLPQTIFLISDKFAIQLFADCLRNDILAKFTVLGKPLNVISVKPDWMAHYFDFNSVASFFSSEAAAQSKDVILMFESFFANRAF